MCVSCVCAQEWLTASFFFFSSLWRAQWHDWCWYAGPCMCSREKVGRCVCVCWRRCRGEIKRHFDSVVSFLNLYLSSQIFCWTLVPSFFFPSPHVHTWELPHTRTQQVRCLSVPRALLKGTPSFTLSIPPSPLVSSQVFYSNVLFLSKKIKNTTLNMHFQLTSVCVPTHKLGADQHFLCSLRVGVLHISVQLLIGFHIESTDSQCT